ncbi:MAG TPA: hypothetical protein VHD62_05350 [Opitutaceae bacterium]|nr:hypothetical protein [Opitutaceae bacterium]
MGFFDRFSPKKSEPAPAPAAEAAAAAAGGAKPRLDLAREKLDAKNLPEALAIYEELLATAGDRADVLVAISGDLGSHGHVTEIIELIAPRYDAERHGPATGLNILQAYLAVRNADAAQHVLDILFALNRPELEERLHGFSNAIAELIHERHAPLDPGAVANVPQVAKVGLITISKPIWFYGLEPLAAEMLPPKDGRLRRIAFGQLALPGAYAELNEGTMQKPADELSRLALGLPLWLAETFYFSTPYAPVAAIGVMTPPEGPSHPMIFGAEWSTDNLRQVVDTTEGGLDYVFTGALRQQAGDYELTLRLWEVKKFRERKQFTARWTPASADAELAKLHEQVRVFMEWTPANVGVPYAPPPRATRWIETLAASLGLFLAEKKLFALEHLGAPAEAAIHASADAASGEAASLAWLTLRARAARLGVATGPDAALAESPRVTQAAALLG